MYHFTNRLIFDLKCYISLFFLGTFTVCYCISALKNLQVQFNVFISGLEIVEALLGVYYRIGVFTLNVDPCSLFRQDRPLGCALCR